MPRRLAPAQLDCIYNMQCGNRADAASAFCWFDERGLPHGSLAFEPQSGSVDMKGSEIEFSNPLAATRSA